MVRTPGEYEDGSAMVPGGLTVPVESVIVVGAGIAGSARLGQGWCLTGPAARLRVMTDQSPGANLDPAIPHGAHALDPVTSGAAEVAVPQSTAPARHASPARLGKVRSPIGCWLLVFITLGIYGLFWYHHTNRELRDYDSSIVVKPLLAVLALFIPIVGLFSVYNTGKRIQQAQTVAGVPADASGVIGVILTFVLALWTPYYIAKANRVWEAGGATR